LIAKINVSQILPARGDRAGKSTRKAEIGVVVKTPVKKPRAPPGKAKLKNTILPISPLMSNLISKEDALFNI